MNLDKLLTKYEKDYDELTNQHSLHMQALQRIEKRLLQIQGAVEALKELSKNDSE